VSRHANLDTIQQRLDVVVSLLTAVVTKDMSRKDAVLTLTAAGLAPKDVAGVLGLTGNQVSVVLYETKQAAAKVRTPKQEAVSGGG
jgi:hypothetical protein